MKRILSCLLLVCMGLSFAACATGDSDAVGDASGENAVFSESVAVIGVALDQTFLQMKAGDSQTLTATVVPADAENATVTWKSDDPSVVKVEDGMLTALGEGLTTVTVTTEDGKKWASCIISVISSDDPIDQIDLSDATEIGNLGAYSGGLRRETFGEIVFSPYLNELQALSAENGGYEDYQGYIRFTYLPAENDEGEYIYPSLTIAPQKSNGPFVDFYLQGDGIDCGFCPIAGASYAVELVITPASDHTKGLFFGTYKVTANDDIANTAYYDPTPVSEQIARGEGQFYLHYAVQDRGGFITGETRQFLSEGQGGSEVIAVPKENFKFVRWSDGVTTAARSGDMVSEDTNLYACFAVLAENTGLANMYIATESGSPITRKEYERAFVTIEGASDNKYNVTATALIRGRGNSSWSSNAAQESYDSKNSYRLKFSKKLQLLGIGDSRNKDWVLNANKFDLSGLRNFIVWDLADKMGTIPYVPECTWVQLYINGEYRGMYMVCELIEVANDRVEINEAARNSDDKGFLLEFDFRGNEDGDKPYFYIDGYGPSPESNLFGAIEIIVKSDISGDADLKLIEDYILRCHEAILAGDRDAIDRLIDIPSLIDMFILEELSKDCDVGIASFFVQRNPGGKLYFTAPWDYDFGFGTYSIGISAHGLVSESNKACVWYAALIKQSWFRQEVVQRMNDLAENFSQMLQDLQDKAAELEHAANVNANFWNLYGNQYHTYVSLQVSEKLFTYQEHIDFLVEWIENRWANMLNDLS